MNLPQAINEREQFRLLMRNEKNHQKKAEYKREFRKASNRVKRYRRAER